MDDVPDTELAAARERGRLEMLAKPRALSTRYDASSQMMVPELTTRCIFGFPARSLQGLEHATDQQLADVEIMGAGLGLGWNALDQHYTVEGLMAGRFGSRRRMDQLRTDPTYQAQMMRRPPSVERRKDAA